MIEPASHSDLPAVRDLLARLQLPLDEIDDHVQTMIVAREEGQVVGTASLELYAEGALLRSVAVDPARQGRRLGRQLTEAALRLAESRGADTVFLLTMTAERYFPKFGFEEITRDEVPASVQSSVEFRSACPSSAIVMRRRLPHATDVVSGRTFVVSGFSRTPLESGGAMTTVLFACVHNAGRSQMAAAWFNLLADPAKATAISAGTDPAPRVHPEVIDAMREVGIELSNAGTTRLTEDVARQAQVLVTMGCGDDCPVVPGARREDWPLDDPKGKSIEYVRQIRDEIRRRVETLLNRERWL